MPSNGTKIVEIMVLLKYISNFWKNLEMSLINCKINLDLNWSENCIIIATNKAAQATVFSITDEELYVPVVTLSTQDNAKLLEQSKRINKYLDFLIAPGFQGAIRVFALPFENGTQRNSNKRYFLPTRDIKKYNAKKSKRWLFNWLFARL